MKTIVCITTIPRYIFYQKINPNASIKDVGDKHTNFAVLKKL